MRPLDREDRARIVAGVLADLPAKQLVTRRAPLPVVVGLWLTVTAMRQDILAVLCAVWDRGAIRPTEVCVATGLSRRRVGEVARFLVDHGMLCALDGEPWMVREPSFPLLGIRG